MSTRRSHIGKSGSTGASETDRGQTARKHRAWATKRSLRPRNRIGRNQDRIRNCDDGWWQSNRSIRSYGLVFLVGTKLADIVTTAVGVRYVPAIIEANPLADHLFVEMGLLTGLTVVGFATVFFAACAAELFGLEVRRRFGLPDTALFAQASIYLILSVLFGLVAIHNALLIADQVTYMLGDILLLSVPFGG